MNGSQNLPAATRNHETAAVEKTSNHFISAGRWPSATSDDPGERELGVWLVQQRTSHASGAMDPFRAEALDHLLPGWLQTTDEAWAERARELSSFVLEHGRMPQAGAASRAEQLGALRLRTQRAHQNIGAFRCDRDAWLLNAGQPLVTVETSARRLSLSETAASSGIQKLVDAGVLKFAGRGKRGQAWSASDVTDEAEGLVQRIGVHREDLLTPNVRAHLSKRGPMGSRGPLSTP